MGRVWLEAMGKGAEWRLLSSVGGYEVVEIGLKYGLRGCGGGGGVVPMYGVVVSMF